MTSKLIDTHFHLDYYKNHKELYETINRLEQYTLCMTTSPGIFVSCQKLYKETKYVKFALGFHPREATLSAKDFSDFIIMANRTNYIGEVGMDFSSDGYLPQMQQIDYFEQIVSICASENKLMSIHLRKSEGEAIEIIKKYHPPKCIVHWFTGSSAQLDALVALNCYFSINTNMMRSKTAKEKLLTIPQNRILIESDGPFTKVDGEKYTPEFLLPAYQTIAQHFSNPDITNQLYTNFKDLLQK